MYNDCAKNAIIRPVRVLVWSHDIGWLTDCHVLYYRLLNLVFSIKCVNLCFSSHTTECVIVIMPHLDVHINLSPSTHIVCVNDAVFIFHSLHSCCFCSLPVKCIHFSYTLTPIYPLPSLLTHTEHRVWVNVLSNLQYLQYYVKIHVYIHTHTSIFTHTVSTQVYTVHGLISACTYLQNCKEICA